MVSTLSPFFFMGIVNENIDQVVGEYSKIFIFGLVGIGYCWSGLKLSYYRLSFQTVIKKIPHSFSPLARPLNYSVLLSEYLSHWQVLLKYDFLDLLISCFFLFVFF